MSLTFGEIATLEQHLVDRGAGLADSVESTLTELGAWFERTRKRDEEFIDCESFAILCEHLRSPHSERVRNMAAGALRLAKEDAHQNLDRARFAVRFAIHRIQAISGEIPLWSTYPLPASEEEDARALFEAARGDRSYTREELRKIAEAFIAEYRNETYLFGRLAWGLEILLEVLDSEAVSKNHKDTAIAALTYFAVVSDAIPDDLGLVGFLDDVVVVDQAIREIRPDRIVITSFLDEVLGRWPFVRDIAFEADVARHPLSEFMLVNAALLLDNLWSDEKSGIAVVVPEPGPLAFLIAFVRSLAEIHTRIDADILPAFQEGERLINRETRVEVEFLGYGVLSEDYGFHPRNRTSATHFRFQQHGKGSQNKSARILPVDQITCLRRTGKQQGRIKRGYAKFDQRQITLGPLEQLFHLIKPLVLPANRARVVLVGPVADTRALAGCLTMFGIPLLDVLPMGFMKLRDNEAEELLWTRREEGGRPILTVVRATSDALAVVEDSKLDIAAVIARIQPNSTDSMNVARIAATGTPVLAITQCLDADSHDHLDQEGFRFWSWDQKWFGCLHWPATTKGELHPIARFEKTLRTRASAKVHVQPAVVKELADAGERLRCLARNAKKTGNESVAEFVGEGFSLLLSLCRTILPVDSSDSARLRKRISVLRDSEERNALRWPDDVRRLSNDISFLLDGAIGTISKSNPKFAAILNWANDHPAGKVLWSGLPDTIAQGRLADRGIGLIGRLDTKNAPTSILVPFWRSKDRMRSLLFPPICADTTLLLYGPEIEWYESSVAATSASEDKIRHLVRTRSPIGKSRKASEPQHHASPKILSLEFDAYDLVFQARRARAIESFKMSGEETIETRLVHFAGGHWAAFSEHHRVHTVTHLLGEGNLAEEDIEMRETTAKELQSGDLVVLLRGSDRDALRSEVDRIAPPGARESAAEWQRALYRFLTEVGTFEQLASRLSMAGCHRAMSTIERWLEDEAIIGPKNGRRDLDAIVEATGDGKLRASIDQCAGAIALLRSLHLKTAHVLADRVLRRTREWIEAGAAPDELVEIEDRLVLVTVETVDPVPVSIPRSAANRLQEEQ